MSNLEKATFAAGCFWRAECKFRNHFSDATIQVGYTGGTSPNPTEIVENYTGHVQACQVEFDPYKTKYEDLVEFFYKIHDPTFLDDINPQYRSVIFYHTPQQKEIATTVTKRVQKRIDTSDTSSTGRKYSSSLILTKITEAVEWYDAEPNHQNYLAMDRDCVVQ